MELNFTYDTFNLTFILVGIFTDQFLGWRIGFAGYIIFAVFVNNSAVKLTDSFFPAKVLNLESSLSLTGWHSKIVSPNCPAI